MIEQNFSAQKLRPGTWMISGGGDSCDRFLLAGDREAVMIDAGCSVHDIRAFAQSLTPLPVRAVINTHSHFDHTGGNGFFDTVYLTEETSRSAKNTMGQAAQDYPLDYEYSFVGDEDIIDPGNRPLQIIKLDCHAPGSIAVLDAGRRLLFPGDEVDSGQVLLLPGYAEKPGQFHSRPASTVETCLRALKKLAGFRKDFDLICPGHNGAPIGADWIDRYMEAAQAVLSGAEGSSDCSSPSYSPADEHYPLPEANYRRFTLNGASLVYCADLIYDSDYSHAGDLPCATKLHRISADTARP